MLKLAIITATGERDCYAHAHNINQIYCNTESEKKLRFELSFERRKRRFFSYFLNNAETRKTLVFGEIGISPGCISRTSRVQKEYMNIRDLSFWLR